MELRDQRVLVTAVEKRTWDALNATLGTTEAKWLPLTDAATAARHLGPLALGQQPEPTRLLSLAKEAVDLWLPVLCSAGAGTTATQVEDARNP